MLKNYSGYELGWFVIKFSEKPKGLFNLLIIFKQNYKSA